MSTQDLVLEPSGNKRFDSALSWAYVQTVGRMAATLGVSLLLARLLGPESFGVIAMASVYVFFIDLLIKQGLVASIVQRPVLTRDHLDTAFWMILGMVMVMLPVSIGLSGWWAQVNRLPDLQPVIVGLSWVLPIKALSVVQEARIRRIMDYRLLAVRTNSAVIAGGAVGVAAALAGWGVWALVAQQISLALVELVVLWRGSDWFPRWYFHRQRARELLGFSSLSAVAGLGSFLQVRVDTLLIGILFGPVAVGLYRLATRLTDMLVEATSGAMKSVSLPELSRLHGNRSPVATRFLELLRLATVSSVPLIGLLYVCAGPLLDLLGPEWEPAVGGLKVLCLAAAVQVPAGLLGPVLQASGRPGVLAVSAWLSAGISAAAFVIAGQVLAASSDTEQLVGLAGARVAAIVVLALAIILPVLKRIIEVRPRDLLTAVGRTWASVAVGVWVARMIVTIPVVTRTIAVHTLVGLAVTGLIGAVVIGAALLAGEPAARDLVVTITRRLSQALATRRKAGQADADRRSPSHGSGATPRNQDTP